jgi:hypothetical protein
MGSSIFTYVRQLEVLVFFSGYPLVYYFVLFLARTTSLKSVKGVRLVTILPFGYALTGTLYLGLQLRNLYPGYTLENVMHQIQQPYLIIWALLSILFWIPAISRRPLLSVFHSLVFFLIIVKDLLVQLAGIISDQNILRNDMKAYTISVFLNLAAFVFINLSLLLFPFRNRNQKS